jgi:hypothetical protein
MAKFTVPGRALFVEKDGWVYYVANWQARFNDDGERAVLVRLSPRHFVRYHELKERGRSQKTICYLLFKHRAAKPGTSARVAKQSAAKQTSAEPRTIPVSIDILTAEQLHAMVCQALGIRIVGLKALTLAELRRLYLAIVRLQE